MRKHTDEICREVLYLPEKINTLKAEKVLGGAVRVVAW